MENYQKKGQFPTKKQVDTNTQNEQRTVKNKRVKNELNSLHIHGRYDKMAHT